MHPGLHPLLKLTVFLILVLLAAGLFWLSGIVAGSSDRLERALVSTIESMLVQRAERFSEQFRTQVRNISHLPEYFRIHPDLRKVCDEKLELMRDEDIRFVYLLWLDPKGRFRFLCDGSESKGRVMQKFDPDDPARWQEIYRSGVATIIDQSQFRELWKSLLFPLRDGHRTRAMLVIDYSVNFLYNLRSLTVPVRETLLTILYITTGLAVLIVLQILYIFLIKNRSLKDSLTGIHNRNYLPFLRYSMPLHRYNFLMIDLDHFKEINDTYGHDIGDQALAHSARLLRNVTKPGDQLIRYGGEEFLLLSSCDNCRSGEGAELANRILTAFREKPLRHPVYGEIHLKASIGLFSLPPRQLSFDTVLKQADLALYQAKKAGRNCFREVPTESEGSRRDNPLKFEEIKRWIEQDRIVCVYQPIYDHDGRRILKYETLVRLKDDRGTLIAPERFLQTIWHTNTYIRMTRQVLEKAVETFKNRKVAFTVNLTLQDLLDEHILALIEELADREPETLSRMGIEILEYHHFDQIERLRETVTWLKEKGISIILDDFGSGHANFFVLQYLPIDEFKIDKQMILEALGNPKAKKLLVTLAHYARDTGLKTTAEYIAEEEIFRMIRSVPVDYLQGYYLGRPSSDL